MLTSAPPTPMNIVFIHQMLTQISGTLPPYWCDFSGACRLGCGFMTLKQKGMVCGDGWIWIQNTCGASDLRCRREKLLAFKDQMKQQTQPNSTCVYAVTFRMCLNRQNSFARGNRHITSSYCVGGPLGIEPEEHKKTQKTNKQYFNPRQLCTHSDANILSRASTGTCHKSLGDKDAWHVPTFMSGGVVIAIWMGNCAKWISDWAPSASDYLLWGWVSKKRAVQILTGASYNTSTWRNSSWIILFSRLS